MCSVGLPRRLHDSSSMSSWMRKALWYSSSVAAVGKTLAAAEAAGIDARAVEVLADGSPGASFQGKGTVDGELWIYDYECYLVPHWPNGVDQVPALVGSVVRTIPHSGGQPGTVSPAGVVASFYAVKAG